MAPHGQRAVLLLGSVRPPPRAPSPKPCRTLPSPRTLRSPRTRVGKAWIPLLTQFPALSPRLPSWGRSSRCPSLCGPVALLKGEPVSLPQWFCGASRFSCAPRAKPNTDPSCSRPRMRRGHYRANPSLLPLPEPLRSVRTAVRVRGQCVLGRAKRSPVPARSSHGSALGVCMRRALRP